MILQEELPTDDVNFFLAYSWGHPRYH